MVYQEDLLYQNYHHSLGDLYQEVNGCISNFQHMTPYLFYRLGSFVLYCGVLEVWMLECPFGSRRASRYRAALGVSPRHAALLGVGEDKEAGGQTAADTPHHEQD